LLPSLRGATSLVASAAAAAATPFLVISIRSEDTRFHFDAGRFRFTFCITATCVCVGGGGGEDGWKRRKQTSRGKKGTPHQSCASDLAHPSSLGCVL
jgi:hypothetical protein